MGTLSRLQRLVKEALEAEVDAIEVEGNDALVYFEGQYFMVSVSPSSPYAFRL